MLGGFIPHPFLLMIPGLLEPVGRRNSLLLPTKHHLLVEGTMKPEIDSLSIGQNPNHINPFPPSKIALETPPSTCSLPIDN
jgi:hypothetical protein